MEHKVKNKDTFTYWRLHSSNVIATGFTSYKMQKKKNIKNI
jgi:hypothetical protein